MQRFVICGLLSLCLTAGTVRAVPAQPLFDKKWMAQATVAAVQELLAQGAAVNARHPFGWTPLHVAAAVNPTPAVTALLLDRGAELEARNRVGWTPLHVAAAVNPTPAVTALLLDRGAELEARDGGGHTPLHLAAAHTSTPAVIALLLDRGADPTRLDAAGHLPGDYAAENAALQDTAAYHRLIARPSDCEAALQRPPARGGR